MLPGLRSWRNTAEDGLRQPERQSRRRAGRGARPEENAREHLAVDRADDQDHGRVDIGGGINAAQSLLGTQVPGEKRRQPAARAAGFLTGLRMPGAAAGRPFERRISACSACWNLPAAPATPATGWP